MTQHAVADRLASFGTTIFTEISALAQRHAAVNLGQGFPDFDGPEFMKRAVTEAMANGANQYARMAGLPALAAALGRDWHVRTGLWVDPEACVTVTSGCTEALAAAILGLVNPGEEVILFEPFYDSYRACVAMAGAVPRVVSLRVADPARGIESGFAFHPDELAAAFGPRTRAILVNTPHNPTGKVFSRDELAFIAALCNRHNVVAITDEVYEHLTYDAGHPHLHLATFDGMAERTLTLSSLGKSFSFTGWKVGWAIGPPDLSRAVRSAHQFLTFATCTPMQAAAAAAIGTPEGRAAIGELVSMLRVNRDTLSDALRSLGFGVAPAPGAYFVMADWTRPGCLGGRLAAGPDAATDDAAVCRRLIAEAGVAAIPPSAFYERPEGGRSCVRFAFCKRPETLRSAVERLNAWAAGAGAVALQCLPVQTTVLNG